MATEFTTALKAIREVMMFENWLRFYFIAEQEGEEDKLFIMVPPQAEKNIREQHPNLWAMVEQLNNKEITPATSREAVVTFVSSELEGSAFKAGLAGRVFDSSNFHLEMQLFNIWVQSHEEQLDQTFADFATWCGMFETWRSSDKVKEYIEEMRDTMVRTAREASSQMQ